MSRSGESSGRETAGPSNDIDFMKLCNHIDQLPAERREALKQYLEGRELALYSPAQFSAITGIPLARVRRWLREKHIRGKKISHSWLIPHSELNRIMTADAEARPPSSKP